MKWKTSDLRKNWGIFRLVRDDLLHEIRLFHVFPICDGYMSSSLSAIFVTRSNDVYALGRNRCMMLGFDNKHALPDPVAIEELSGIHIQAIDTGLMHTLALTDSGRVWAWGLDVEMPYSYPVHTAHPRVVDWLETYKVLQIACGSYFNLALTDSYTVMYWGYYDITHCNPLKRLISFKDEPSITSLSSGLLFSAAVGSSGKVYTWTGPRREEWTCSPGMSTYDVCTKISDVPLGRKMTKKERPLEPRVISFQEDSYKGAPLKVVCTMRSLYILMDTGKAYVTGYIPVSFKLNKSDNSPFKPDERSFCDSVLSITCAGYPVNIAGSKWTDNLTAECINPENFFLFDDNARVSKLRNIASSFADSPTPQMRSIDVVDQDFDEPVYVSPRLDLNKELFCSEALSDVKFLLADKVVVPAHKYVLLAHSQHFRNMYGGDWKETKSDVIDVSKYNPTAYKTFLRFLYTGVLDDKLDVVDLLELYHLADEYLETSLKQLCLREITKCNIDSSTVAELYDWAVCNDLMDFARKCVEYGASHLQDVLKSDGFANMTSERREVFVKELFSFDKSEKFILSTSSDRIGSSDRSSSNSFIAF